VLDSTVTLRASALTAVDLAVREGFGPAIGHL
jgi:hypothetical protein